MSTKRYYTGNTLITNYECDLCRQYTGRVLTDSYTGKDICFDCASGPSDHGLFYTITQDPEEDEGDNLMKVAEEQLDGRFVSDDEEDQA